MTPTLPRRALGATGIEVSVLGLGTVKFGRDRGVRYPHGFQLPSDAEAGRLLDLARESGINLLDTAPAYGQSEARLGRLLRRRRNDFVLVTKCGEFFDGHRSQYDFTPAQLRRSVQGSLARLRTDHIDCLLLHSDGDDLALLRDGGAIDTLVELKREGLIRSHGISTRTVAGGLAAVARMDVIMITLAPQTPDEAVVAEAAQATHCGVLVKKALGSGHQARPEALRWAATQTGVHCVVVGTIDPAHLRTNAAALADLPA